MINTNFANIRFVVWTLELATDVQTFSKQSTFLGSDDHKMNISNKTLNKFFYDNYTFSILYCM